ncbi:unnamed protein product [marine sediment metagenome]|uniref:DUF5679 domain-containing protein n=1 Tax=marine sediment metagenome TaxID=412755 RepID=X1ASI7_9ZZZZ
MKCRTQREIKSPRIEFTKKRNSPMLKGVCGVCDTNLCRLLSKQDLEALKKSNRNVLIGEKHDLQKKEQEPQPEDELEL